MNSAQEIKYANLDQYFYKPENEYCHAAVRNRLLVAISRAEIDGYNATREALIELLRDLEKGGKKLNHLNTNLESNALALSV